MVRTPFQTFVTAIGSTDKTTLWPDSEPIHHQVANRSRIPLAARIKSIRVRDCTCLWILRPQRFCPCFSFCDGHDADRISDTAITAQLQLCRSMARVEIVNTAQMAGTIRARLVRCFDNLMCNRHRQHDCYRIPFCVANTAGQCFQKSPINSM